MALLKALNEQYANEIDIRLARYNARRGAATVQKRVLKKAFKSELGRPGVLAGAFALGMLITPKSKAAGSKEEKAAKPTRHQSTISNGGPENTEEGKEDKHQHEGFVLMSMLSSVATATLSRLVSNWITSAATASAAQADSPEQAEVNLENRF